jgi:hypothetical protein
LSGADFLRSVLNLFPILRWLPAYNWKRDFVCDLMSGFTVGVMQVPQGKKKVWSILVTSGHF